MTGQFLEVLIAPSFDAAARKLIAAKKNVRVLEVPLLRDANHFDLKRVGGGLLVQTPDTRLIDETDLQLASERAPTDQELRDLLFAWKVVKFVKSNAVVSVRTARRWASAPGR